MIRELTALNMYALYWRTSSNLFHIGCCHLTIKNQKDDAKDLFMQVAQIDNHTYIKYIKSLITILMGYTE